MDSLPSSQKPHVVCFPVPLQGHINPMMKLAKLLHFKGFHITFVNTEYNHQRLLKSKGPNALDGLLDFRFEAIPDGLPPPETEGSQDIPALASSLSKNCLDPLRKLLAKLNSTEGSPPVSCMIVDGSMSFSLDAAEELGIPVVLFWTPSASGVLCYMHYASLIEKGIIPMKDESYLTNGYLDQVIDWIPGMKNIRLKDFPSFIRTTNRDDVTLNYTVREAERTRRASAVILNTFDEFEHDVLIDLKKVLPPIYTIGPLNLLINHIPDSVPSRSIGSNLWKEESECLQWLDTKEPNSVVYVNFGSITVVTAQQLIEFAWGLANSKQTFLWIIRPDLVRGDAAMLPPEFLEETKDRSLMASWCSQEEVLKHPAIGGFLTHCGWNSTLESVCCGIPMLCWPFFAEQLTNCRYSCTEWGIGMEIDNNVKRDAVEKLVIELMEGEKSTEMRKNVEKWKTKADDASSADGPSFVNLDRLINEILLIVSSH